MSTRSSGASTLAVAAATAACGLFLLTGLGPSPATGESSRVVLPAPSSTQPTTTTEPDDTPTTTSTSTSSTTSVPRVSPVPLSVEASDTVVGAGGVVAFRGTCSPDATGRVVVWIIGTSTDIVQTGVATAASWSYAWTAPTDPARFGSFVFQFWCGDPSGFEGGYPAALRQRVDMVASAAPPTTVVTTLPTTLPAGTPTTVASEAPAPIIPETR